MSAENGQSRIISLEERRANTPRRGNDLITVQQCHDMVIQECAKVHEYYLTQIPPFVARMIQDALLSYGLIVAQPPALVEDAPEVNASDVASDTPVGPQADGAT